MFVSVLVTYEKCPLNEGQMIRPQSGRFVAPETGMYDFTATALLKTDDGSYTAMTLKRDNVSMTCHRVMTFSIFFKPV